MPRPLLRVATATVQLLDADATSPEYGRRISVRVAFWTEAETYSPENVLVLLPESRLAPCPESVSRGEVRGAQVVSISGLAWRARTSMHDRAPAESVIIQPMHDSHQTRLALASAVLGWVLVAPIASAQTGRGWRRSHWAFGMDLACGVRAEAASLTAPNDRPGGTDRSGILAAPSVGLDFGREFSSGLAVRGVVRFPPFVVSGQLAAGAGVGYVAPLGRGGLWLSGMAWIGYSSIAHPFDRRGIEYAGAWARTEIGVRYRLLQSVHASGADVPGNGFSRRLDDDFDVYLSFAFALDVVRARYPEAERVLTPPEQGWRLGPDASVGVGFLF